MRLQAAEEAAAKARRKRLFINLGLLLVAFLVVAFVVSRMVGGDDDTVTTETTAEDASSTTLAEDAFAYGTGACAPADGSAPRTTDFADAPERCIDPAKQYTAVFDTTAGPIRVALDTANTPGTANNFVNLARFHYYDGTPIFRTDPSIDIIQGGGADNTASPGYTIPDEGGPYTYEAGQLVMARSADPDSAGGQFFFVAGPNAAALDAQGTYVVFGTVSEGLDVVQQILASHQADPGNPLGGAPNPPVTITSVTIEES